MSIPLISVKNKVSSWCIRVLFGVIGSGMVGLLPGNVSAQDLTEGEELFNASCSVCHTVGEGKLICADLIDVHTKYDESWLIKYIESPEGMISDGDETALRLYKEYDEQIMPDTYYSEDEIKNVLAWIKSKYDEKYGEQSESLTETQNDVIEPKTTEAIAVDEEAQERNSELKKEPEGEVSVKLGKKFFRICSACHTIGEGKLTGPDLYGEMEEHDPEWIINFVKNPKKMIDSGDPEAVEVYEEYAPTLMPAHGYLSDTDILSIIEYVKEESAKITPPEQEVDSDDRPDEKESDKKAEENLVKKEYMVYTLLGIIGVLVIVIMVLSGTVRNLARELSERDQEA